MARYADIDVLLEHLTTSDEGNFRTAITQWLEMHQVEDVEPVELVHAHWIKNYNYIKCSNCGLVLFNQPSKKFKNYCSQCGAKMDEEVNK